jgi:hypothetical protein
LESSEPNRWRDDQDDNGPDFGYPHDDPDPASKTDNDRKVQYGYIYGLYTFNGDGECKKCGATNRKLNKVGHCEPCQDELDRKAGVVREKP